MPTTFQKRQKEMKRMEKQRMKAERRAQRKAERNAEKGSSDQADAPQQEAAQTDVEIGSPEFSEPQAQRK